MTNIGDSERKTQNRVIKLFTEQLGYTFLGDWHHRPNNRNIEPDFLEAYLAGAGYSAAHVSAALHQLQNAANIPKSSSDRLYSVNKRVYGLLRYGAKVKVAADRMNETVHFIDWDNPEANHFGIAEEVTLEGDNNRRPDLVLYVNGIAVGVIELKSASVSVGDGIRQCISNQRPEFHRPFFSTVQFLFAGNESQAPKYGTIGTPQKYWLQWKEEEESQSEREIYRHLRQICRKERFIELIRDFMLYDGGVKKVPRVHQYLGVKAAQANIKQRESGVIWHTQGSGKSIVMVFLARWILENLPNARVALITDRTELDKQIKRVFEDAGEEIYRAKSGRDLLSQLGKPTPRLLCSLVHKFGVRDVDDFNEFIASLESEPISVPGDLFLFVDECHRTQSGKLHRTMKAMLPDATFIGFTGTPLLKKDKQTSREVFGRYIHTYTFDEAVRDNVVLDLIYDPREVDQMLGNAGTIDSWFEAKTKGLNDYQKNLLQKKWATMRNVLSSKSRMRRIVTDINCDFGIQPRLETERGNAMLVVSSIYEACRYYRLFEDENTSLRGKCAVVTSYDPNAGDISKEDTGENTDTAREFIYRTYVELLKNVQSQAGKSKTEVYEDDAKRLFQDEPANMKLLIVVDKLLTGFNAPSCTYMYLDKSMQDHGLFQAICRTNRLDGEDKKFGYIVDYKDLFTKVENALAVYTGELDDDDGDKAPEIAIKDRLNQGRMRLEEAREAVKTLCADIARPNDMTECIWYFCGSMEDTERSITKRARRDSLYETTAELIRAFADIDYDMHSAGYTPLQVNEIRGEVRHYSKLRDTIRNASDEFIDVKLYEADMRQLIDNHVFAGESQKISTLDDTSLVELLVARGVDETVDHVKSKTGDDMSAVAETITHNVRSHIIKQELTDPAYFSTMSEALDELIAELKARRIEYKEYLERIAELAAMVKAGRNDSTPASLDTQAKRALYNNLGEDEEKALRIHRTVIDKSRDGWRGNGPKERELKNAIRDCLEPDDDVERVFDIVKNQAEY